MHRRSATPFVTSGYHAVVDVVVDVVVAVAAVVVAVVVVVDIRTTGH